MSEIRSTKSKRFVELLIATCLALSPAFGDSGNARAQDGVEPPKLILDFPVLDLPYNATDGAYTFPSMRQSLHLSTNYYQVIHHAIGGERPDLGQRIGIAAFDVLSSSFPIGLVWLHEEWHRAVFGHRGIGSHNDTYDFPIGENIIAVSHVRDEDLVRLKRDFPADQVRLNTAGMESQLEQNLLLEKRRFFFETQSFDRVVLWMNHLNVIQYLNTCASGSEADKSTDEQNASDGTDLLKRDFTGLDCTAWAYDLYRPEEPYSARGTHPSGVGIDRYRKFSDLSEEEKQHLRTHAALSFLNLLDPFLLGFDAFPGGPFGFGERWNALIRHHITSFGATIDANIFVKDGETNWLFQLHNQFNAVRYFPGVSAELLRYPLAGTPLNLSSRASLWLQPEGQRVKSTVDVPGAMLAAQVGYPVSRKVEATLGIEGKTPGWVAGNVYLERNVSLWTGATVLF